MGWMGWGGTVGEDGVGSGGMGGTVSEGGCCEKGEWGRTVSDRVAGWRRGWRVTVIDGGKEGLTSFLEVL